MLSAVHAVCMLVAQSLLLSCKTETVPRRHSVPVPSRHLQSCFLCLWNRLLWDLVRRDSKHLFFCVWLTSLSIMPLGFIQAVGCVRTAFLSGWTTFTVWMGRGLLVCPSAEGRCGLSAFISHVLSYLWNSFRKPHDPKVIHHYLLCKLFSF